MTLAYLDLFPDGRFVENSSFGYRFNPRALFARRPASESEAGDGWQAETADAVFRYTPKAAAAASSAG